MKIIYFLFGFGIFGFSAFASLEATIQYTTHKGTTCQGTYLDSEFNQVMATVVHCLDDLVTGGIPGAVEVIVHDELSKHMNKNQLTGRFEVESDYDLALIHMKGTSSATVTPEYSILDDGEDIKVVTFRSNRQVVFNEKIEQYLWDKTRGFPSLISFRSSNLVEGDSGAGIYSESGKFVGVFLGTKQSSLGGAISIHSGDRLGNQIAQAIFKKAKRWLDKTEQNDSRSNQHSIIPQGKGRGVNVTCTEADTCRCEGKIPFLFVHDNSVAEASATFAGVGCGEVESIRKSRDYCRTSIRPTNSLKPKTDECATAQVSCEIVEKDGCIIGGITPFNDSLGGFADDFDLKPFIEAGKLRTGKFTTDFLVAPDFRNGNISVIRNRGEMTEIEMSVDHWGFTAAEHQQTGNGGSFSPATNMRFLCPKNHYHCNGAANEAGFFGNVGFGRKFQVGLIFYASGSMGFIIPPEGKSISDENLPKIPDKDRWGDWRNLGTIYMKN